MRRATVIFRKELTDTLRDKRTIIMMVVVPLLVVPLLMTLIIKVGQRQQERAESKQLRVAVIGAANAPELAALVEADSQITTFEALSVEEVEPLIRDDSLDGAMVIPAGFRERVEQDLQATVQIYFKSTSDLNVTGRRLTEIVESLDDSLVAGRIQRLQLDEKLFDAIAVESRDVATVQEQIGEMVGGFLPYMFVLFCFMGSMYPGIDLGAGEKERGTLETLLVAPANMMDIVLGKFLVVCLVGLSSALISMLGLWVAVSQMADIPPQLLEAVGDMLNWKVIGLIATLLVPLEVFFAAAILAVSIYSRSFKEAQSSLTPLNLMIIAPVAVGLMPGMELSTKTALVPVLNVSLATRQVIGGTIDPFHLVLVYVSLFVLAAGALAFCVAWFRREEVLFRA